MGDCSLILTPGTPYKDYMDQNRKIKPLMPCLREKKRYLVYEVLSKDSISTKIAFRAIKQQFQNLFGSVGSSEAGLTFIEQKSVDKRGVIRVKHTYVNKLKMSLALIENVEGKDALIHSIGVTGILKKTGKYTAS